jgi:hypothetical protein
MSCVTDAERAQVSKRIGEITERIVALNDRLNLFAQTQELPPELSKNDKYPIPEDGFELAKLQHANRNAIRRCTERIATLFKKDPNDFKIKDQETKLRSLKIYKQYIDESINRRKDT